MVDPLKLNFFIGHWPELHLQMCQADQAEKHWPREFKFFHPEAVRPTADDVCIVEITKAEWDVVQEAVYYYLGE